MSLPYDTFLMSLTSNSVSTGVSTSGPVTFNVGSPWVSGLLSFRVKNLSCQNAAFNVTSASTDGGRGYNLDQLVITGNVTGALTLSTLPAGLYNQSQLLAALSAAAAAAGLGTLTFTVSDTTKLMTVTVTAGPNATISIAPSTGWRRLGFTSAVGPAASVTGAVAYRLNMTDSWRLYCPTLASIRSCEAGSSNTGLPGLEKSSVIFTLPIAITLPWFQSYNQIPSDWYNLGNVQNISVLEFQLLDDNDFPVILAAQTYWSADLEFRCLKA